MKEYLKGLKIGLGVVTPIVIVILLVSTVFAAQIPILNQSANSGVAIPDLLKGQSYMVELVSGSSFTCIDVENKLGLPRGYVKQLEIDGNGNMKITFMEDYKLSDYQVSLLSSIYAKPVKEVTTK